MEPERAVRLAPRGWPDQAIQEVGQLGQDGQAVSGLRVPLQGPTDRCDHLQSPERLLSGAPWVHREALGSEVDEQASASSDVLADSC